MDLQQVGRRREQWLHAQGAGWLEVDFTSPAYADTEVASLQLRLNTSGLPLLGVVISVIGRPKADALHIVRVLDEMKVSFNISAWEAGEYEVRIDPDTRAARNGWCGGLLRFLRKEVVSKEAMPSPLAALPLPAGQPLLLLDDFWLQSRHGTARRIISADQIRVINDSFLSTRIHASMSPTSALSKGKDVSSLEFTMDAKYSTIGAFPPGPSAESFLCTGRLMTNRSDNLSWACTAHHHASHQPRTDLRLHADEPYRAVGSSTSSWPPAPLPRWPLASTRVRWYEPSDGPVDIYALAILYRDGTFMNVTFNSTFANVTCTHGSVTLNGLSGYPYWQRQGADGVRETLILTVEGKRQALIYAQSFDADGRPTGGSQGGDACDSALMGRPNGPTSSDPRCVNDNFAGYFRLPARTTQSGRSEPASFTYSQGRRVPTFAPNVAPMDNIPTISRVLSSWRTYDGLHWEQRWWGEMPMRGALVGVGSPQQYGADMFCSTPERSTTTACYGPSLPDASATLLAFAMPYDAMMQRFDMDIMFSRDGEPFRSILQDRLPQDGSRRLPTFVPAGAMGSWNGGIIQGARGQVRIGNFVYALLPYVTGGYHFMGTPGLNFRANFTPTAFQQWADAQYFAPTIRQWMGWEQSGGWPGIAHLAERARIEVGVLHHRFQGWVALQAIASTAIVMTRPVIAPRNATVTLNLGDGSSGRCALVELYAVQGTTSVPIAAYSDEAAAQVCVDHVEAPLHWGGGGGIRTQLPESASEVGVVFRIRLATGLRLYGLTLWVT